MTNKLKIISFLFVSIITLNLIQAEETSAGKSVVVNVLLKPLPSKPYDSSDKCLCARKWVRAARGGGLDAMTELANCYAPDVGAFLLKSSDDSEKCKEDKELKSAWLGAAATRGYAPAQYAYGMLYFFGVGVPIDKENAANWLAQAAGQGYPEAYFSLGEAYQFGLGRPQSLAKALEHFKKAASLGEPRAKARLQELNSK
jgi:TPR repeat protein